MQQIASDYKSLNVAVAAIDLPRTRRLNFVALVSVIFFTVCGGAFGIESLFGKLGPGWAIVLIVLTPLFWSIPISLMVSELAAMMPVEGGYYVWVKRALGDFWGFQEGWWTCLYSAVDMAIYPVLFVNYLAFFLPAIQPDANGDLTWNQFFARWAIAAVMIFFAMFLNWRGAKAVGYNSVFFLLLILLPFASLTYFGFASETGGVAKSIAAVKDGFSIEMTGAAFAAGLATVMWNYSGWDNVSTYAAEVNDATRNYPRALFTAMALAVLVYLIPTFALVGSTTDPELWSESAGFPALAESVGGPVLGSVIAFAALASAWSLFNSQILYASRLPFAMANDGWLPSLLRQVKSETGVPTNSLLICCVLAAVFAALPFGKLVVMDIILYSSEIALEFVALIVLRLRQPDEVRPFKIPGGMPVIALITIAPAIFAAAVVWATVTDPETDTRHLWIVAAGILSGVVIYYLRRGNREARETISP